MASPVRARTPLGERSPNVAPVRQAVTKKPTRAARRTAARRTVAPYAGVPVHSVDRVACRACDAFLLFGECVELLPAGNGFHCAIKAERGLELESLGTLTATPHENAGRADPARATFHILSLLRGREGRMERCKLSGLSARARARAKTHAAGKSRRSAIVSRARAVARPSA